MINSIPRRSLPYFPAKIVKWIVIAFIFAQCSGCIRSRLEADSVKTVRWNGPMLPSLAIRTRLPAGIRSNAMDSAILISMDRAIAAELESSGVVDAVFIGDRVDIPFRLDIEVEPENGGELVMAFSNMLGCLTLYTIPTFSGSVEVEHRILVLAGDNPVATYEYRGPRISSWNWVGFLFLESEDYGAAPEVYGNSSRLVARRFIEDIRTDGTLEHLLEFAGSLNRSNQ